jgi:hypothetical protein
VETVTVEEFWSHEQILENAMKGVRHLLLKIVPVRESPWRGFTSLGQYEVQFWNDLIMDKVAAVLLKIMKKQTQRVTDYFWSLNVPVSRSFLGSMSESLFPAFIQKVSIKVSMMKMNLFRTVNEVSVKRDGEWNDVDLYQAMEVCELKQDLSDVVGGRYCYYKPSSIGRMYDAIVMPNGVRVPIDIIQITVGRGDNVASDEFESLFNKFGRRKFRHLMIRIGSTTNEAKKLKEKSMEWRFMTSRDDIKVLRGQVEWFECVWDFEKCLTEYLQALTTVRRH